ncbi:MAG: STM4012 family radical SAM protein [Gluconacetobacter diazotrophicus]|nr:STM4012 family radical SAM protein [Gluconacetobacter diazotrophicus]
MSLRERLALQPFQGYAYSYPHKLAYRPLAPSLELTPLWAGEDKGALFLYVHVPFCEMRCGFCNLFTTANPQADTVDAYLGALERQMRMVGETLGPARFARAAFGGGTPTFLSEAEIERLFAAVGRHLGGIAPGAPVSFEMSPATVSPAKLRLLAELGVTRASIGVQSFLLEETKALGRPQNPAEVRAALTLMRAAGFRVLNLDLIYGASNQTPASWEHSLREAMHYDPEEIYLYPLYVRPLTGLDKLRREPSDARLELYRRGRDFLLARGYRQLSMRLFRRADADADPANDGPVYCCQEDGMVGLGAGARSYTRDVHYSSEYAVGRTGVREIIADFVAQPDARFAQADYGCTLTDDERRRRYVIKSLLRCEGLSLTAYRAEFGTEAAEDFSEVGELLERGLATLERENLVLTDTGLERSDTIGPALFSREMQERMEAFDLT